MTYPELWDLNSAYKGYVSPDYWTKFGANCMTV